MTSVDPKGDIAWVVRVPKRQASSDDDGKYSSYAVLVKDQHIHLVFNDSGKNLFLKPGEKAESFNFRKDRLVTLVTINAQGTVFREALLSPEVRDAVILPKSSTQISDDRLFIYAEWRKDFRFGTVVFE